ncbi:PWWP domain-containing protein 1 [Gastrolobium bilobum]|uniref:PWWP domain-containing protein 1 n=1 Tax=Gastrolobium bilobum TaxID=150636 RepID=UPI002AAFC1FB|nr:PWWP domain-containing protein 1 [Gastrolobium bilobum]
MSHHHKDHSSAVTETTGDSNPNDRHRDSSSVDSRLSEEPLVTSTEQLRVRVCSEGDSGPALSTIDRFDQINNHAEEHDFCGSDGKSMLYDEGYGFEVGEMVWGKVKSHPWWPGHIYNEAFASSAVRRTKREGHVLVAFFGDSSYGWFEPAELIPFDANFAEKSKQLSSRPFLKAVEEAVDEASRRCGLALVCRCRNPPNFRPTNVEGYFSVHVPDYEPGVYSNAQIKIARNSFRPIETLGFLKQLAFAPHGGDHRSISFSKNKATVSALRRALFEQYDETYAQAFGVQTLRPSDLQTNPLDQPVRQPAKAPLSGPMVIAETLGAEKKSSTKSVKVKDNFKKDKYLFKRRDEPTNSFQLASSEETPDAVGHYAFQKRPIALSVAPQILEKHEDPGFISQDGAALAINAKEAVADQVQPDSSGTAPQEITLDTKPYLLDKAKESSEEMTKSSEVVDVASKSMGRPDFSGEMALPSIVDEKSLSTYLESKTNIDVKQDGTVIVSGPHEDFQQTGHGFLTLADGGNDMHQIKSASNVVDTSPVDIKHHKLSVDGVLKKVKAHKQRANDLNSETSAIGEKKKKKKKTSLNLHPTSGHLEMQSTTEKSVHLSEKLIGKPVSIGLAPREDSHGEPVQVDVSASNLLPMDTVAKVDFELPQLLGDLQALALDPFYGVKRGIPAAVRQFFLRFRSLVYQKSLFLSPATENEAPEVHVIKSPSSVGASDSPDDHARASPHVKPVKHVRPDDPTKAGRKRALSDRQEEINAKRLKKTKDLKTLAAEKKAASHKTFEARRVEGKELMVQAPPKMVRSDSTRKVERPAKPVEPTILVIKFPPKTSLPSVAELKARFARFGPIDQSGLRVFWKTSTCRVVFLHKIDAQSAYKYAVANPSLFGNVGMRCYLREFGDSSSEVAKAKGEDAANETPRMKDPAMVQRQTSVSAQQPLLQPMIQLKSILKKSTGDELGQGTGNGGSSKGTPRVKFMLGGEESSRGEQLMVGNRNNFNNASFADVGAFSPVAMDFNSKNVQKVISQPSLPNLPPPTQFTKIPQHNLHNSEMAPRNIPDFINTTASASTTSVDISQQMISLLTRCNDVVTNLTDLLGYVPYHPL